MTETPVTEWINALSARVYSLTRDCPAKVWNDAPLWHPAVGRALQIDRSELGGVYALAPFKLAKVGDDHRILAAWPAPRILTADPDVHTVIEAVIAWNPITNTAEVVGDPEPQLAGRFPDSETAQLFADPRAYFQSWAIARAGFYVRWQSAMRAQWQSAPTETDLIPGCLLIGDPNRVNWYRIDLPQHIDCIGIDPAVVNRAIFKSVRLPRVTGQNARQAA